MKDVELMLISELMKNSRRSDRELAKTMRVSQPTVTRLRAKLEKAGVIKEYTIIPDFSKLGYHLCSFTLAKFAEPPGLEAMRKAIVTSGHRLSEIPQAVMIERGMGLGANGIVVSLHKDYTSYLEFQRWIRQFSLITHYELESFLVNLDDDIHYRYLTFSTLAKHMLGTSRETKE